MPRPSEEVSTSAADTARSNLFVSITIRAESHRQGAKTWNFGVRLRRSAFLAPQTRRRARRRHRKAFPADGLAGVVDLTFAAEPAAR